MIIKAEVESLNIYNNDIEYLNNYRYILFKIREIDSELLETPVIISLLWEEQSIPSSGQVWLLSIKTKVVHAYLNEGSFDSQRFAIANRRLLTGNIKEATLLYDRSNLRQNIVNSALPYFNLFHNSDVMIALAFGERSRLTQEHKTLMFQTGIAHLMAISGMHIILVAFIGNRLIRLLQSVFPIYLISYWQPLIFGWGCAVFYAWLSGLNPPAIRAIIALSLWLIFRYRHIQLSSWQMINRIIAILLFIDPLMILSESFWLSCYAVICLIFISQWFPLTNKIKDKKINYFVQLIHLQFLLTVLLLPIQIFLFNGISNTAIITNLIAIPVISFITFPAIIMTMLMSLFEFFELAIWSGVIADNSLNLLYIALEPFVLYWFDIPHSYYLLSSIGWLTIITCRFRFWCHFFISLGLVVLIMLTPIFQKQKENWRIDMLDIGHGLAVVIRQGNHAIIYDTGAKWKDSSAAERIIVPFLKWHNLKLEGIIISHEHNDHIGGLPAIQKSYPNAWLLSSSPNLNNDYLCISGNQIFWHHLTLSILWPNQIDKPAFNSESCVVQISDGRQTILLTGDLEKKQEEELVLKYGKLLFSNILQIPHHGSNTSSSYPFLAYVNPTYSLGSVSRYNSWNLPSNKAISRYDELKMDYFLTQNTGQISLLISVNNIVVLTMRTEIKSRWYHEWFGAFNNNRVK